MWLKLFIKSFKEFRNVQKRKETSSLPLRSPKRLQLYQNTAFRRPSTVSIMNIFSPTTTFSAQMSEIGPASSLSQSQLQSTLSSCHPPSGTLVQISQSLVKNSKPWAPRLLQVSLQARYNLVQRIEWVRSASLPVHFQYKA